MTGLFDPPKWWLAVCFAVGTPIYWIAAGNGHSTNGFGAAVLIALYLYLAAMYWNYRSNPFVWAALVITLLAHIVPLAIFPLEPFRFPGIVLAPLFALDAWFTSLILNFIIGRRERRGPD